MGKEKMKIMDRWRELSKKNIFDLSLYDCSILLLPMIPVLLLGVVVCYLMTGLLFRLVSKKPYTAIFGMPFELSMIIGILVVVVVMWVGKDMEVKK